MMRSQRWRDGYSSWARQQWFDPREHEVALMEDDRTAKGFITQHHYLGSYPSARFRFGIYRSGEGLVGVAVFSTPCRDAVLTSVFPTDPLEAVDLGRFVLLDHVEHSAETWMLARCFEILRRSGIKGVVAFSDPMPRATADGRIITPGHVGTIYQAHNATYLGQSRPDQLWLLPDGRVLHRRTLAKVRNRERGHARAVELIVHYGAGPPGRDLGIWLDTWLPRIATRVRHPGNHKYAWALDRRLRRHLPATRSYPKKGWPDELQSS